MWSRTTIETKVDHETNGTKSNGKITRLQFLADSFKIFRRRTHTHTKTHILDYILL